MTRAQHPDGEIDYASSGAPGAENSVIVLRLGSLATVDPDSAASAAHGLHLLLVRLDPPELDDPPVFGGETPAGSTTGALVRLAAREHVSEAVALVAERATCGIALILAAERRLPARRLVLVTPELPAEPLARDLLVETLRAVEAETLVLTGADEPEALAAAEWYASHLPNAVTRTADAGDAPDGRMSLDDVWGEVVDFLTAAAVS